MSGDRNSRKSCICDLVLALEAMQKPVARKRLLKLEVFFFNYEINEVFENLKCSKTEEGYANFPMG